MTDLDSSTRDAIVRTILQAYPTTQAICLSRAHRTDDERPESDVDLALLLPHVEAKAVGSLALGPLWAALVKLFGY